MTFSVSFATFDLVTLILSWAATSTAALLIGILVTCIATFQRMPAIMPC